MIKHLLIWIGGFLVASISGMTAIGAITKNKAPELSVVFRPLNGFAAGNIGTKAVKTRIGANLGVFPDNVDPTTLDWAKQAFRLEPATPEVVAVLALDKPDTIKRRLMDMAFELSRREQLVNGWMIADSGARNDVPAILNGYDTLLRTSNSAAPVVIPVMAGALSDENFIEPFADVLSKNPPWESRFWRQVLSKPEAIENAARLRQVRYKKDENTQRYRDAGLISALVKNKKFNVAENLYVLLSKDPAVDPLIRNGSFQQKPQFPPLDWRLYSNGEFGAAIANGDLQLNGIQNSGGLFARQLIRIPPAVLQLDVEFASEIPDHIVMNIQLSCAEAIDDKPKGISIPISNKSTQRKISGQGSRCRYYWLDIVGRASDNTDGFDLILDTISLSRS